MERWVIKDGKVTVKRWTKKDVAEVQRLSYLMDLLIGIALVFAVAVLISFVTYDQPYSCFDSAAGRELSDGTKSLFGSFVEATSCVYDDYWGEYTCDQGVYKYCNEGSISHIPFVQDSVPPWDFQLRAL